MEKKYSKLKLRKKQTKKREIKGGILNLLHHP